MREIVAMHAERPLENEIAVISLDEVSNALTALDEGKAKGRYVIKF
jgi:propanol-preferring alcohol dehydrogenase